MQEIFKLAKTIASRTLLRQIILSSLVLVGEAAHLLVANLFISFGLGNLALTKDGSLGSEDYMYVVGTSNIRHDFLRLFTLQG